MLKNKKSILHYGLCDDERKCLTDGGYKLIEITDEMTNMKLEAILDGYKFETVNENIPKEKVIIFNNLSDEELKDIIKIIRAVIPGVILAVVTPTSAKWAFKDLLEHLVEERNWYKSQQKGR
ncbi:DUF3783 domain-containing protein [Clostridium fallax]|uniref:DUF3783 domain-containing protein n=1 Tax=Clostridium fallax TaxID=1533 RepID=A0A1M4T7C3_9CLOT|nr:DUF3783 domain-containing protein [Clostridium fallax]SHE40274.1 protein of unknown function [Clostridium fallax]SQB22629.1 Domain of uncharacterised function (DUF3783) [Clostridium fallax]